MVSFKLICQSFFHDYKIHLGKGTKIILYKQSAKNVLYIAKNPAENQIAITSGKCLVLARRDTSLKWYPTCDQTRSLLAGAFFVM